MSTMAERGAMGAWRDIGDAQPPTTGEPFLAEVRKPKGRMICVMRHAGKYGFVSQPTQFSYTILRWAPITPPTTSETEGADA